MPTDTNESKPCVEDVLLELAKEIYALHCAINQLSGIPYRNEYQEELRESLNHKIKEFSSCGGIIDPGYDVFGAKTLTLSYPESKKVIPYNIGRMRSEELLSKF